MLKAIVKSNIEPYSGQPYAELEVGESIEVEEVFMNSCTTDIVLKNRPGAYNSVCFDFEKYGNPHDIYRDPEYNPYLPKKNEQSRNK